MRLLRSMYQAVRFSLLNQVNEGDCPMMWKVLCVLKWVQNIFHISWILFCWLFWAILYFVLEQKSRACGRVRHQ